MMERRNARKHNLMCHIVYQDCRLPANALALADFFCFGAYKVVWNWERELSFCLLLLTTLVHLCKCIHFTEHWWGVTLEGSWFLAVSEPSFWIKGIGCNCYEIHGYSPLDDFMCIAFTYRSYSRRRWGRFIETNLS